ncbi:MAG TPA: hypothetical protein VEY88_15775, partial [Archangium sp.]|nr:hypothetical protein [Archangium sp.]
MRLPVVAADHTAPLEVVLMDAAGRTRSRSLQLKVTAPGTAPTAPTGLPSVLYASPYHNAVRPTASSGTAFSLRVELDGVVVASQDSSGTSLTLSSNLVLPPSSVGTQVTLTAVAEDVLGREARTSQVYTVQPDDMKPTVSLSGIGSTAIERTSYYVYVYAGYPPGHQVRSVRLFANGVEILSTTSTYTSRYYTFASAAQVPQVVFKAVAVDHLGREAEATQTVNVLTDTPPYVSAWVTGEPLIRGTTFTVCGSAFDDVQLSSARLLLGNEVLFQCSYYCPYHPSPCFTRTVPAASSLEVRMEATDNRGQASVKTVTYPIQPPPPPNVKVSTKGALITGRPYEACVLVSGYTPLARISLSAGGETFWSCNGNACTRNQEFCVSHVAPLTGSLVLGAEAVDVDGLSGAATQTYAVEADLQPPTIQVVNVFQAQPPDFLIAGTPNHSIFYASATDDSHLRSMKLLVGEAVVAEWTADGTTPETYRGLGMDSPFVPASPGEVELRAIAEDGAGQQATTDSWRLPVLAPGTGLTCAQALSPEQLSSPSLERIPSPPRVNATESICNEPMGVWQKLPFDGPVDQIFIRSTGPYYFGGMVGLRDGCDPNSVAVCAQSTQDGYNPTPYTLVAGPLSAEARLFVYRHHQDFEIVSARLGNGARCVPDSNFLCTRGSCLPQASGEYRCVGQACGDGVDNDGDGRVDYPEDPGCTGPLDAEEDDPPVPLACANGVDDDGDGLMDWPEDPGCASRSGFTESGDGESCQSPAELVLASTPLAFDASTDEAVLVCGGAAQPDRVLSLRMPGQGQVALSGGGLSGLALREYCADGFTDLACSNTGIFRPQLSKGTYFVVAEGMSSGTLEVSGTLLPGASCDPAQPWIACPFPQACAASAQGFSCQTQACGNGLDDDGDGIADFPEDFGCESWWDPTEEGPVAMPACGNGVDDDGDGFIDWPLERGCSSREDGDETDPAVPPRCSNGLDDDGDGRVDHGADTECSSVGSDDEGLCRGALTRHLQFSQEVPYFFFSGESASPFLSCFGANTSLKKSFHWVAPSTGQYLIWGHWEGGELQISVQSPG